MTDAHRIELKKMREYSKAVSFIDLVPRSFTYENQNLLFSETNGTFLIIFYKLLDTIKRKVINMMLVT